MSEIRRDVIKDRWVIVAGNRSERPFDFASGDDSGPCRSYDAECPFCKGNEDQTPPEKFSLSSDGEKECATWQVRVVNNKFPALDPSATTSSIDGDLESMMDGFGVHEVLIETPYHDQQLMTQEIDQIERILTSYQHRLNALNAKEEVQYVTIFKNKGRKAGASLHHPHTQILATPFIPELIQTELNQFSEYYRNHGRCLLCDLLRKEIEEDQRIILNTDNFVSFVPYAARVPYELTLAPKFHERSFAELGRERLVQFGQVLQDSLARLREVIGSAPYNFVLHTSPVASGAENYHWHLELTPRLTTPAGFEWGGGNFINPLSPEQASRQLDAF